MVNSRLECTAIVLNINLDYNKDVMEKCQKLKEYNEQAHIEYEKEISYEDGKIEGRKEGRKEGLEEGIEQTKLENARNLLGLLPNEIIAEKIGLSLECVEALYEKTMKNR